MAFEILRDYWPVLLSPLAVGAAGVMVVVRQSSRWSAVDVVTTALLWTLAVWLFTVSILTWEGVRWYEGATVSEAGSLLILTGWRSFMLLCLGASVSASAASVALVGLALAARKRRPNPAR